MVQQRSLRRVVKSLVCPVCIREAGGVVLSNDYSKKFLGGICLFVTATTHHQIIFKKMWFAVINPEQIQSLLSQISQVREALLSFFI